MSEDHERPATPVVVTAPPAPKPEVKEAPSDVTPAPTETDPPHESGYGFGV